MKILINDGWAKEGIALLEEHGFEVLVVNVAQEQLAGYIDKHAIVGLIIKNNTQVDRQLLDACPSLEWVAHAGSSVDNVDRAHLRKTGIAFLQAREAQARAVAELAFAHLLGGIRALHDSNRNMPLEGESRFLEMRRAYAQGGELQGKVLGILGLGHVGKNVARMALGLGMEVAFHDPKIDKTEIDLTFFDGRSLSFSLTGIDKNALLQRADFLTLHTTPQEKGRYVIGKAELDSMKPGAGLVNTAHGSALDEVALVDALNDGKLAFAALDVYESEPRPEIPILMHPKLSLSPHIGGETVEARARIALELAAEIVSRYASR